MSLPKQKRDLLGQKREARKAIYDAVVAESRSRTPEETTQYDALGTEIKVLEDEVRFLEQGEAEARAAANIPVHGAGAGNAHSSDKDQRDLGMFSLGRVVKRFAEGEKVDGIDAEVLAAGKAEARQAGAPTRGNVIIPYELFAVNKEGRDLVKEAVDRRDMTATGTTSAPGDQGGLTITTTIGRLYEALFNTLVLRGMGSNFMPNMVGNYTVPRVVKGTAPGWKAENATADEVSPTVAGITLTPHRLPAFIEVSNQLFLQSDANFSQVVQRYLINALSEIYEAASINGAGAGSNMPLGILNTPGIKAVYADNATAAGTNANGAALVWEDIVALYSALSTSNTNFGSLGYLLNPATVGKLQTTLISGNTAAKFILEGAAGTLNAFKTGVTGNVPSNLVKGASGATLSALVFGNFNDFTMCMWGGLDLLVNPYSRDTEGLTRINAAMYADSAVVRPESFSAIKDAKLN